MVLDGVDRNNGGNETCGMDRQTLRDWVLRYNATGAGRACAIAKPAGVPDRD